MLRWNRCHTTGGTPISGKPPSPPKHHQSAVPRRRERGRDLWLTVEIFLSLLIISAAWTFKPAMGDPWRKGLGVSLVLAGLILLTPVLHRLPQIVGVAMSIGVVYLAGASRLLQAPWHLPGTASLTIVPGIVLAILVSCAWVLPDSDRLRNRTLESISLTAMLLAFLVGLTTWLLEQRLADASSSAASCGRLLLLLLLFGGVSSIVARDGRSLRRIATLTLFVLVIGLVRARL